MITISDISIFKQTHTQGPKTYLLKGARIHLQAGARACFQHHGEQQPLNKKTKEEAIKEFHQVWIVNILAL